MNMLDWARKEVELACEKERGNAPEGEFDYGCACYESVLKAFEALCGDGHSGFSIGMTKHILNRLIDGKPLTPIEDTENGWNECVRGYIEPTEYQNKRMSSLFKEVYKNGTVKYYDVDSFYCVNINNPSSSYHSGLVGEVIQEMFPITMPYMPGKPIKVYCEDFLTDPENGDFDTVGVFYALKEGQLGTERIEINRYFREPMDGEEGPWVETNYDEYLERKSRSISR